MKNLKKMALDNITGSSYDYWMIHVSFYRVCIRTQSDVGDDTAKYKRCQKWQGDNEAVEKAVIAFAHTVPNPWAVVIKSFWGEKKVNTQKIRGSILYGILVVIRQSI